MDKLCIWAVLLLTGCDVEIDQRVTEKSLEKLNVVCTKNSGFKTAARVTKFSSSEWRVDCKDGAKFVITD
jgi:hypothetical protein